MERVSLAKTLLLLEAIKLSPSTAQRVISEFQEYIWDDRVQVDQNEILEILRDLAHDLDYFEADPSLRAEESGDQDWMAEHAAWTTEPPLEGPECD